MLSFPIIIAQQRDLFEIVAAVGGWVLFGVIMLAFLVFGTRDLVRLSWARISAISSVSFQESIRRRVLWITPLAIVGAVVVSQLQNAIDPQDAIRQTTKICLFATGLVVTLTAIILACTSLPKEIDNRVIYTIVTKPTTRLEIVLGKVWGFAKVSAAILLIMGLFTYGYLQLRAWRLSSAIAATLETLPADAVNRPSLEYYQTKGLLNAKAVGQPAGMQVLAEPPVAGQPRWMAGGQGQQFGLRYQLTAEDYPAVEAAFKAGGRMAFVFDMPVEVREPTATELETIRLTDIPFQPVEGAAPPTQGPAAPAGPAGPLPVGPELPGSTPGEPAAEETPGLPQPVLTLTVRNPAGDVIVSSNEFNDGKQVVLPLGGPSAAPAPLEVAIPPAVLDRLFEERDFELVVEGASPAVRYALGDRPVTLRLINPDNSPGAEFAPRNPSSPPVIAASGRFGQQIIGGEEGKGGVAVFHFDGANLPAAGGEDVTVEVRAGIERGGEGVGESDVLPNVQLTVRDTRTGALSQPHVFQPETNRTYYVAVPRAAFPADGGPFDVLVRVLSPDQWLGVKQESVSVVTGERLFSFNLLKSLLILWLMSVLVVAIAVFCSTFVSWPIAVVLTLVLLLGRWGVDQIRDASGGRLELGAQFTARTENAAQTTVVRESIDALGRTLEAVSAFLPDVSRFQATADIERGVSVPLSRFSAGGWVLLGYGIPIVILAYLILKRKEVAP